MAEIKYWEGAEKKPTYWVVRVQRGGNTLSSLSIRGVMLMVATLGLYRFWFVSDLRRFFWSRTLVDDSPLEYTGRGLELFVGFLIAVLILLPLGLGLFGLSLISSTVAIISNIGYFILLTFLGQYALYRARRYRLNRTVWRGLRLHLTGSAWLYAFKAMGWFVLSIITIGLAWPWASASLERHKVNNTRYGNLKLHSTAKWSDIIKPYLLIWAVLVFPLLVFSAIGLWVYTQGAGNLQLLPRSLQDSGMNEAIGLYFSTAPFIGLILYPWYRAVIMRTYFSRINAKTASLKAEFSTGLIYKVWIKSALVMSLVTMLLGLLGFMLFTGATIILPTAIVQDPAFLAVVGGIAYITWIAVNYVVSITIYHFGIWFYVGNSMLIQNPECIEETVAGAKDPVSGVSEGFADALDVGGGFEIGL